MTAQAIEYILGRTVDFETEVILANEGHGVYIKEWRAPEARPTQADIDAAVLVTDVIRNENAITAHADSLIYSKYSQIKQNKLNSQWGKLVMKVAEGGVLTADEIALRDNIIAIDTEISNIRDVENTAISNGTALANVVWPTV